MAKAWERELQAHDLPYTRRVALRTAIVLGDAGVLGPLRVLTWLGLGGTQIHGWWPVTKTRRAAGTAHLPGALGGRQRFSWIHVDDALGIIEFIEQHPEL